MSLDPTPTLDALFAAAPETFGADLTAYRNHCARVVHFARALAPTPPALHPRIEVAAFFHDVGIWTDRTWDYLPPSIARAITHLRARGLDDWTADVEGMIACHHQLTDAGRHGALVEAFRRADLVDVSLGAIRFGLPSPFVAAVRASFPNAGFHRRLLELAAGWVWRHPLDPMPMMRWSS
jgi:hypothetical protein